MGRIHRLDPALVNQIAAGEVIDRPASVVKELVENALDAGARRVLVEIEEGGRKLIRVSDDGTGIAPDDIPLAFAPHATSKIASAEDLFAVRTLGFRGEALASVASVSHLALVSRVRGAAEGASMEVRGGEAGPVKAAGAAEGTVAEVRNLFFNVPVRRGFLRSVSVEFSHVAEAMTRFALAHPGVRFELRHDGRVELALPPAEDPRPRIARFFGEDLAKGLLVARSVDAPFPFTAWLAPPAFSRPGLQGLYVFLGGRFIRDKSVTHAVREAYRELVMEGRQPVAFLYLDLPPSEFDVNVHPTKIEVRFRNGWRLHDRLVEVLRAELVKADLIPAVPVKPPAALPGYDPARVQGAILDFFSRAGGGAPSPSPAAFAPAPPAGGEPAAAPGPAPAGPAGMPGSVPRRWQVHGRYIIEEVPDGIVVVDQHALHERVRLEAIRLQWEKDAIVRQRLLVPAVVELTPRDLPRLEECRAALESFGVEWEDFGENTVVIRTVPDFLRDADPARLLRDFLDEAAEAVERPEGAAGREAAAAGLVDEILHFLACRSAVKAGESLAPAEVDALLADRERLENAATCAHGRPVALRLTLADLERYFKRT
jgi:DNA mismatch repair protein MutL